MAVTNSGMTLYTDNDTQQSWTGTDDLDAYNFCVQGSNSESWQVSSNKSESASLPLSADMTGAKFFIVWMASNITNNLTSIDFTLDDGTNVTLFAVASSTEKNVTGEFHPVVLQISEGDNPSYNPTNHAVFGVDIDNSSSGNIRAVINNWIDTMHYGNGRTIGGSTDNDKLFLESHTLDTITNDEYDGCSELFPSGLSFYTDITLNTTSGKSYGETITFAKRPNTDGTLTLTIVGNEDFKNTNIKANDDTKITVDSLSSTSFSMIGGGITNGGNIDLGSSQAINTVTLTSCNRVKSASVLQNVTITDTTETTTGAYEMQTSTELSSSSTKITINNYNGKYAVYIPASITGSITIYGVNVDGSGTDVYWAGTSGTLTINASGGTNLSSWSSAGGTVDIQNSVTLTLTGLPDGIEVRIRQGSYTLHHVQDTSGGSVSYGYNYSGDKKVKVSFIGAGIIQSKYIELTLGSSDQSVPVQFENDPSYI